MFLKKINVILLYQSLFYKLPDHFQFNLNAFYYIEYIFSYIFFLHFGQECKHPVENIHYYMMSQAFLVSMLTRG